MKTILVTGATAGIGQETARQLLQQGHRVLVHGRHQDQAQALAAGLRREIPGAVVDPVHADLASMAQVVDLAQQVLALAPVLDVLLNNAGTYARQRQLIEDGFELTMAVNHFATQLLTMHLLPSLQAASQGRVVTVSSTAHARGKLDLADLTFAKGYDGIHAYETSKLANVLFTRALARRLQGTPVTSNCLHPGVITTNMLRAMGGTGGTLQQGARTSVYLALEPALAQVSGKYFIDLQEVEASALARDEKLGEDLWRVSEALLRPFL